MENSNFEFTCDHCKKKVDIYDSFLSWKHRAKEGYPSFTYYGFTILCRPCAWDYNNDINLDEAASINGMTKLLIMAEEDVVEDMKSWTEVFYRLHVPNYEEARHYIDRAKADGFLDGASPEAIMTQETLKDIIMEYRHKNT